MMRAVIAALVGLLMVGTAAAETVAPDFGDAKCKAGTSAVACLRGAVLNTSIMCEVHAGDVLRELGGGALKYEAALKSIDDCTESGSNAVQHEAKAVSLKYGVRPGAVEAVKRLRLAHKVFLIGLRPDPIESERAYNDRKARLKESIDFHLVAVELETE